MENCWTFKSIIMKQVILILLLFGSLSLLAQSSIGVLSSSQNNVVSGPVTPPELLTTDTYTYGWYSMDRSTFTKNASEQIASQSNSQGTAPALAQATDANKPIWTASGVSFDGISDRYSATMALTQPMTIYIVCKISAITTDFKYVFFKIGSGFNLKAYTTTLIFSAGTNSTAVAYTQDQFFCVKIVSNGASSTLQVNDGTIVSGNFGASVLDNIFLFGSESPSTTYCQMIVPEIIIRHTVDTGSNMTAIWTDYLKPKYGL